MTTNKTVYIIRMMTEEEGKLDNDVMYLMISGGSTLSFSGWRSGWLVTTKRCDYTSCMCVFLCVCVSLDRGDVIITLLFIKVDARPHIIVIIRYHIKRVCV